MGEEVGRTLEPFKVGKLQFVPSVDPSETDGTIEELVEVGDWITLGYIEPTKTMKYDDFLDSLYDVIRNTLEKVFDKIKRELEEAGYEVERSGRPLFYVSKAKDRIWFKVKKNGVDKAYCEVTYDDEPEGLNSEVYVICEPV